MNKTKSLKEINELALDFKNSIHQRGGEIRKVYEQHVNHFLTQQFQSQHFSEWHKDMSVSQQDLKAIYEYMISSSFVSAWYHLTGDKAKRDQAAQSCSTLVSSLGEDPEKVMLKYLDFERFWRRVMKEEGIAPRRFGVLSIVFIAIVVIILIILFT